MNTKKIYFIALVLLLIIKPILGFSQKNETSKPKVQLLVRIQKDKVLLRWGVDEALAWKKSNKKGFVLEKYILAKNGEQLKQPQKIWQKNIKAAPLPDWEKIALQNNYAAIIAQAIYGESFMVEGEQGALVKIANTLREIEQRFSFALMAADMNFEAAKKAGWGFEDTDVDSNFKYIYKIKAADDTINIQSSSVLVTLQKYEPLPPPIDVQGIFRDKKVIITWEYALFKRIYTSYNLQKSEDGKNFITINKEPLVNMNDKPKSPSKRMFYIDTLAHNNKKYYYRVQGISSFGEKSNYSKIISGFGQPILPFTPRITDFKLTNKSNEALLFWKFPKEGEAVIQKFQLNQAEKEAGPYKVVVDNIPVNKRQIVYSKLKSTNYFTITAIGKTPNQQKTSFTTLIQPIDSVPPIKPTALKGTIDSTGVVHISWKKNEEPDLLGYKIFRGFTKKGELSAITVNPILQNTFIDTVKVKNLNSKVYYQIVAIDERFNHSKKSSVLVLKKPDVIPPTSPVFSNYKVTRKGIQLQWIASSEEKAIHQLLRKNKKEKEWKEIFKTTDTIQKYIDTNIIDNEVYSYQIIAIDSSGLKSKPMTPLTIKAVKLDLNDVIKNFSSEVNRLDNFIALSWKTKVNNVVEYTIYKQKQENKPSIWKVLPANIISIIDKEVTPNNMYTYYIRATLTNGGYTKLKTINVKY